MGWLFCSLIAIPVAILPTHAAETTTAPTRIRVVADAHYPPFLFLDADGKPQGYVADMWKLFQAHTGIQVDLLPEDWPMVLPDVLSGRADVVGMLYRTPAREALYDFSAPYAKQPVSIYVERRVRGVHDIATLRNFPVGVERGGVCAEKLAALGVRDLRTHGDYEGVIAAAVHGDLRVFCMSEDSADYALYREAALDRFSRAFVLFTGEVHAAVRKGNVSVLAAVDRGMAQITPAERAQLRKRWLDRESVVSPYVRTAKLVLAAVAVLVALMALWVWMLRRSVGRRTRALKEEKDKLRALFEASPDIMLIKDRHGVVLDCNDRVTALVPDREQMIGASADNGPDKNLAANIRKMDQEVLSTGERRTSIQSIRVLDGSLHTFEVIKVPLPGPDGGNDRVLTTLRDISERLKSEERLQMWAHAFQHAAFGVEICDLRTRRIVAVNPTFARERGYTPEEMAGMPIDRLYPDEHVAEAARRAVREKQTEHVLTETVHIARDGRSFPVSLDCSVVYDTDDQPLYALIYAQDISERKQAENELRLAAVAFQTQDAVMVMDADRIIRRVNGAFTKLTGYAAADVVGKSTTLLRTRHWDAGVYRRGWEQILREGSWQDEQWIQVKDGQSKAVRLATSAVFDDRGRATHFVCSMVDLTSERAARASVDHMMLFDPLTDLPNRNHLHDRLQQAMDRGDACDGVLLLIDLDHFKRVNDLRGHTAGDRLLVLVTQRLRRGLQEGSFLSRFSGGAFAVLIERNDDVKPVWMERAHACAERLREILREPFDLGGDTPVMITASIGWTAPVSGQTSPEAVFKEVELAMYAAKSAGRDLVRRFEPGMQAQLVRHETLVHELRRAINAGELDLHLQAQVDRQGTVAGAEALVRWTRPCGESVPPSLFIPLAEDNGLIVQLGDRVLRRACERLVAWSAQPARQGLSLAINVSARQFASPDFIDGVREVLAATGANPARLKLEITESAVLDDLADAAVKLRELRAMGIRASLDDFGTGYSSLTYLARLPLDQLKIDQSFVARLPEDNRDAVVAHSIIRLGRGLGLEVIAEGVETEAQWHFLMEHGCDAFQGYLFGRPLPCEEFEAALDERRIVA